MPIGRVYNSITGKWDDVIQGIQGPEGPRGPQGPEGPRGVPAIPDLISQIKFPMIISHRGGALVYPEESMEGFRASARDGFYPEMDIQFTKDNIPVLCHDTTANRTMTGITGNISDITLDQWRTAKINPRYKGGRSSRPVTFEEVLDEFGGKTLIIPEIKTAATDLQVKIVTDMIYSKNLQRSVLLQTFDYYVARRMQEMGFECVYLMSNTLPQSVDAMWNAGIRWAGPSRTMSTTDINSLIAKGIKVLPYTCQRKWQADALPKGVSGYFSDDPWQTSGRLQALGTGPWERGEGWPGSMNLRHGVGTASKEDMSVVQMSGSGLYFPPVPADTGMYSVSIETLTGGPVQRGVVLRLSGQFLTRNKASTANMGFHLMRESSPSTLMDDAAVPGQNGFTIAMRRNSQLQVWEYRNGAAAASLGSSVTTAPNLTYTDNLSNRFTLEVMVDTSTITVRCPETSKVLTVTSDLAGPFTPYLRVNSTEAIIRDVSVVALEPTP